MSAFLLCACLELQGRIGERVECATQAGVAKFVKGAVWNVQMPYELFVRSSADRLSHQCLPGLLKLTVQIS